MAVIHVLALWVAAAPRFWSVPAVVSLLVALLDHGLPGGPTRLGYHRLSANRSFRGAHWLERVSSPPCGAFELPARSDPTGAGAAPPFTHRFSPIRMWITTTAHRGFLVEPHGLTDVQTIPHRPPWPRITGESAAPTPTTAGAEQLLPAAAQIPLGLALFWIGTVERRRRLRPLCSGDPLRLVIALPLNLAALNSAHPRWGQRPPTQRRDSPRQQTPGWTALTFGEGWHNNHHAFPPFGPPCFARPDRPHLGRLRSAGLAVPSVWPNPMCPFPAGTG